MQPSHVHRISTEALHIYSVIIEQMSIKPIIVPHFQMLLALQIRFEIVQQPSISTEVIDEYSWPSTEVVLRTSEKTCTDYFALPDGRLLLDIQIYGLSIPGDDTFGSH